MPDFPVETAIERAREALSLDNTLPVHTTYVARLDLPGKGYYLAVFGPETASIAVAAIDAQSGEVSSHAHLSGGKPQLLLNAMDVSQRAGVTPLEPPRLVWRPCLVSRSMLNPIWEIRTENGIVYVDQHDHLWKALEPTRPGG
jgi:hypothetical protein